MSTTSHATAAPAQWERPAVLHTAPRSWQRTALALICLLAAILYVWGIGSGSFGNPFYAAAVKSMSQGLTQFLFGAYDPAEVLTVDKPPLSLWPQVISAWIFGYHGWSLLLPQVIEGVATVFLLHRTVRRWAGENVALLASLLLTLTPITVAINRDNNPDTLLMLFLVAAAYVFTRSIQTKQSRPRTGWLLLCAFLLGCGFVTKMLQAWIIVPGLALAFFAGVTGPVRRRILDILGAGVVLLVASFWWSALHSVWPGHKPYIGGSTDGSAWDLIFGYNGFGRIFGEGEVTGGGGMPSPGNMPGGMGAMFGGDTGITRMFGFAVGPQISWLLPLSLIVLVVVVVRGARRRGVPGDPQGRAGWTLWGSWLLVTGVVFSYAKGIWHPYYTTMLAPAIAAISAAGLALLWRYYHERDSRAWLLLPGVVAVTTLWAITLGTLNGYWHGWARWITLLTAVLAIAGLVVARSVEPRRRTLARPALLVGLVAIVATPAVWSTASALENQRNGVMPAAGPDMMSMMMSGDVPAPSGQGMAMPPGMPDMAEMRKALAGRGMMEMLSGKPSLTDSQRKILDYARRNGDGAKITLAVEGGAMATSNYIITSDATVVGMGGFLGSDNAPTTDELSRWTSNGTLRYVVGTKPAPPNAVRPRDIGGMGMPTGLGGPATQQRGDWLRQHCRIVDPAAYGESPADPSARALPFPIPGMGGEVLYDCRR